MKKNRDDLIQHLIASGGGTKRSYLSLQHLSSARLFAKSAQNLEDVATSTDPPLHPNRDHRAFVVGAVLSSVAFLEASINELFADAAEGGDGQRGLGSKVMSRLMLIWSVTGDRARILDKYDHALLAAELPSLERGGAEYGNVKCLVRLRNALVHSLPKWQPCGAGEPTAQRDLHQLEKTLKGKFALNRLADPNLPFYPDRCLGGACAQWSVDSSEAFHKEFRTRMGLPEEHTSELLEWQ